MLQSLPKAISALDKAVSDIGGVDAAMAACERMYQASFRSEPYVLSPSEFEEERGELMDELVMTFYSAEFGKPDLSCERAYEYYYEASEEWFGEKYPAFKLSSDTEVVYICNYKGEGEGVSLYSLAKNLPVFVDKNTSFFQANS